MNNSISINYQVGVDSKNPVLCGTYRKEEPYKEIKRRLSEGFLSQVIFGRSMEFQAEAGFTLHFTVGARIAV